jgi:hypothetical protein
MRVPDHQPDGTELEARGPVPPRNVSIRHPVGHSGRSTGAAGACHVFVGSKAPWFEIADDLPQYAEYAPPVKPRQIGMRQAAGMNMQPAEFGAAV